MINDLRFMNRKFNSQNPEDFEEEKPANSRNPIEGRIKALSRA